MRLGSRAIERSEGARSPSVGLPPSECTLEAAIERLEGWESRGVHPVIVSRESRLGVSASGRIRRLSYSGPAIRN